MLLVECVDPQHLVGQVGLSGPDRCLSELWQIEECTWSWWQGSEVGFLHDVSINYSINYHAWQELDAVGDMWG